MGDTLIPLEAAQPSFLINTTEDSTILGKVRYQPPGGKNTQECDEALKDKTIKGWRKRINRASSVQG